MGNLSRHNLELTMKTLTQPLEINFGLVEINLGLKTVLQLK